jgi:hypothetical protein
MKRDTPADCFYTMRYKERLSPRNRQEALAWQLHDDVRQLYTFSGVSEESFEYALNKLEASISGYRQLESQAKKTGVK